MIASKATMKGVRVLNRAPAPIQITAEQIILEARDRGEQARPPAPKQHITDPEELAAQRLRVRKEFEDRLRMHRQNIGIWLRYAKWEDSQQEVERARSVYERALDVDFKTPLVWQRYAEMEMRCKFVSRARNVWDRAVSVLPRVDSLWFKYTFMEEMLGNVNGARAVFERWVAWEPPAPAWLAYVKLEERAHEPERARAVLERYAACHPGQESYLRLAKWEERRGQRALARRVYERATEDLRPDERDAGFYAAFAKFEERCGEFARAGAVYRYALERLPKAAAEGLHAEYVAFEKQHGDRRGVEGVILAKRRGAYAEAVSRNAHDYDAWFDLLRLEEAEVEGAAAAAATAAGSAPGPAAAAAATAAAAAAADLTAAVERCRDTYERAVAAVPPLPEKRYWRRYVYLWIYYAVFEESVARDAARARAVYRAALAVVPHAAFTFSKLWLLAAQFEVRARDVGAARRLLGAALGRCPREKVLRGYIALELSLGEVDRVRRLYERWLALWPASVAAWARFAELERSVGEDERARAIYDLAVAQPSLDMPEVAWKAYIDFEIERGETGAARGLYAQLLARTQHVKVWLSLATFEAAVAGDAAAARAAYARGYAHFKAAGAEGREARALLLDAWRAFEAALADDAAAHGGDVAAAAAALAAVDAKQPRRVVKRRETLADDGVTPTGGWEEYYDYVFPDDEAQPASLKLLALAQRWKAAGGNVAAALRRDGDGDGGDGAAAGGDGAAVGGDDVGAVGGAWGSGDGGGDGGGGGEREVDSGVDAGAAPADPNAVDLDGAGDAGSDEHGGAGAGRRRPRPMADGADDAAGGGDGGDGDAAGAAKRARVAPPAESPLPDVHVQPVSAEGGDVEDAAVGREAERELEDVVHAAPTAASVPRDLYCEEDAGDAADRD